MFISLGGVCKFMRKLGRKGGAGMPIGVWVVLILAVILLILMLTGAIKPIGEYFGIAKDVGDKATLGANTTAEQFNELISVGDDTWETPVEKSGDGSQGDTGDADGDRTFPSAETQGYTPVQNLEGVRIIYIKDDETKNEYQEMSFPPLNWLVVDFMPESPGKRTFALHENGKSLMRHDARLSPEKKTYDISKWEDVTNQIEEDPWKKKLFEDLQEEKESRDKAAGNQQKEDGEGEPEEE